MRAGTFEVTIKRTCQKKQSQSIKALGKQENMLSEETLIMVQERTSRRTTSSDLKFGVACYVHHLFVMW